MDPRVKPTGDGAKEGINFIETRSGNLRAAPPLLEPHKNPAGESHMRRKS